MGQQGLSLLGRTCPLRPYRLSCPCPLCLARLAKGLDRTIRATRITRGAAGLAKGDEIGVPRLPIPYRKNFSQRHLGIVGGLGRDEAEAVGDAVDMDVHADAWFVKAQCHHEVGGLASHTWQLAKLFNGAGQHAPKFFL